MSPYPQDKGQTNKVLNTGRILYVGDGTNFYPISGNASGNLQVVTLASTARIGIAQREPFEFRPGQTTLASGAVAAGSRTSSGTVTTGATIDSTVWGSWITYQPLRSGLIDGKATGGIIEGQLTIGHKSGAGTVNIKVTAQIANTANTGSPTTVLALTGAISVTVDETFNTYDLNWLQTDSAFNAVPFSVRLGIQTAVAASSGIGRLMESSAIRGEFEPGT